MVRDYKELLVWQRGRKLVKDVYHITENFPEEEKFVLTSQLRRSAISIPSNIAEGHIRGGKKDYSRFLSIAIGSAAELETQIILASDLNLISNENSILEEITVLRKMLNSLRNKLK